MNDYVYDWETYPNYCSVGFYHIATGTWHEFEISEWINEFPQLVAFLRVQRVLGARQIGYNNIGFDYPINHFCMQYGDYPITCAEIYNKAQGIIHSDDRFANIIWPNDRFIEQLDVYLIHHFDNENKRCSLKQIEFNMRSQSIQDLPYKPGYPVTYEQARNLRDYRNHDIMETFKFFKLSADHVKLRAELSAKFGRDFTNHNDTKIGKDILIDALGPELCYQRVNGRREPRQTYRTYIDIESVIFPYVRFANHEFERIRKWFCAQKPTETKGVFSDITCTVDDIIYTFGTGGLHGSVKQQIVSSSRSHITLDIDVAGYYPSLAIANDFYPSHLGQAWCTKQAELKLERKKHKKGSSENTAYKLALNGSYGDTGNAYSPFYDTQYMVGICVNGQLSLCMLIERMVALAGVRVIQANTDGITVHLPIAQTDAVIQVCDWWQTLTKLQLEYAVYDHMFIKDGNNYLAVGVDGKIKRKGAYAYTDLPWHANQSELIIPRAAEAMLLRGEDILDGREHDPYDWCAMVKAPRSNVLTIDGVPQQNILRYYVSTNGGSLLKTAPPPEGCNVGAWKRASGVSQFTHDQLAVRCGIDADANGVMHDSRIHTKNRSKYAERNTSIAAGWTVTECNDMTRFNPRTINLEYYRAEVRKLLIC